MQDQPPQSLIGKLFPRWEGITNQLHWRIALRWLAALASGFILYFLAPRQLWLPIVLILGANRRRSGVPFPRTTMWVGGILFASCLMCLLAIGVSREVPQLIYFCGLAMHGSVAAAIALVVISDILTFCRALRQSRRSSTP